MKNAFRIGEVARLYGIGTDTIRYYEEHGLVTPNRAENGYRMYSIHDIWRMNVIRDLRALGFSVERIREYLNNRSVETTLALLHEERAAISAQIARLSALDKNVATRMKNIKEAGRHPTGVVRQLTLPARRCHQIEESFATDEEVDVLMKRLLNHDPQRLFLIGSNNLGCRVPKSAVISGQYQKYSAAFIIDGSGENIIPGGQYLCLRYNGLSKQTSKYVPVMLDYAKKHGLAPAGDLLELIWIDIHEAADTNEHVTELQLHVENVDFSQ